MKQLTVFGLFLGLTLAGFATAAQSQQKDRVPRIGIMMSGTPASHKHFVDWFREGLTSLGYVEGTNFVAVHRWGMGKRKQLPLLLKELIQEKVDVIVINGSGSVQAAREVSGTFPFVVGLSSLLLRSVDNLAHPGGNITGSTYDTVALGAKRLALLKEVLPDADRVDFLFLPSPENVLKDVKGMQEAGKGAGVHIQPRPVRTLNDMENAFERMAKERANGVIIRRSGLTIRYRNRLAVLAVKYKVPTICDQGQFAPAGCLLTYTPNQREMMKRAAVFVDKILKGAMPADLPVEIAAKYDLVLNFKTAKALDISFPPSILLRATEVIE